MFFLCYGYFPKENKDEGILLCFLRTQFHLLYNFNLDTVIVSIKWVYTCKEFSVYGIHPQ